MTHRVNSPTCPFARANPLHHCRDAFGNDLYEDQGKPCYYETRSAQVAAQCDSLICLKHTPAPVIAARAITLLILNKASA